MSYCRNCYQYKYDLNAICRVGKGTRFEYKKDVFICGPCLADNMPSFDVLRAGASLLIVRDKKNKCRYDILKDVYGFKQLERTSCDNSRSRDDSCTTITSNLSRLHLDTREETPCEELYA